jgi:hypothetical protein
MKQSLKDRLLAYMLRHHDTFIASGELQRLVMKHTTCTARTAVRRLEELAEEGKLEVIYKKGHAWYRARTVVTADEWFESLPAK